MENLAPYRTRQKARDRISYLPTELQTRILSLLPDREILETRILSKQWQNICSSLSFQSNIPHCSSNGEANTINITLHLLQGFNIQTLKIHGYHLTNPKLVQDLHERISFIGTRNIVQLELVFFGKFEILPCQLFTCETLTVLKLRGIVITDLTIIVDFLNLKTLTLEFVDFWNQTVTTEFFNGCAVLEYLNIRHCKLHCGDDRLTISCPILKALEIDSSVVFARDICIPSAVQFYYKGEGLEKLIIPISNLCNASFEFVTEPYSLMGERKKVVEDSAFNILQHMPKIVRLSLLGYFLWYLVRNPDLIACLPTSHVLEHLEIEMATTKEHVEALTFLLSIFPNLQTLRILIKYARTEEGNDQEPDFSTKNALMNLGIVEVKLFDGCKSERDLVKYFLGNARMLKKMNIKFLEKNERYMKRRVEINRKIQKFGRASPDVVLLFSPFQI